MAPKVQKSKEQKAAAATAGGKARKKKWSKGKTREKANHHVFYSKDLYDQLVNNIPKGRLITAFTVTDKLKVNASLARKGLAALEAMGHIKAVEGLSHGMKIYTRKA